MVRNIHPDLIISPYVKRIREEDGDRAVRIDSTIRVMLSTDRVESKLDLCKKGAIYYQLHEYDSAKIALMSCLNELPALSRPWYYLAELGDAELQNDSVLLYIKRSIFLDANDHLTLCFYGKVLDEIGLHENAESVIALASEKYRLKLAYQSSQFSLEADFPRIVIPQELPALFVPTCDDMSE
jgi:tetratricopeptide (TPR) repeat protein